MININRLENLSKKGREGNSYYTVVKLAVLPSERYIRCTRVLANCISPEVKQDFSFSVKELSGKVLRLSVFDASLQKQHEAVGHALLTLEDIICDQPKKYRIKLYRRTQVCNFINVMTDVLNQTQFYSLLLFCSHTFVQATWHYPWNTRMKKTDSP